MPTKTILEFQEIHHSFSESRLSYSVGLPTNKGAPTREVFALFCFVFFTTGRGTAIKEESSTNRSTPERIMVHPHQ